DSIVKERRSAERGCVSYILEIQSQPLEPENLKLTICYLLSFSFSVCAFLRCIPSMEWHYRERARRCKGYFKVFFQPLFN
ncbi:hypothetical protein, partial [Gallaecimonas xiamenensis]|uniref:hypothetical protein n=1 Tax=Gallaecimonas xiamenensis TaxID=1207039 RepID=UPI001ED99880